MKKCKELISNTRSFDGTNFATNLTKIWGAGLYPPDPRFHRPCCVLRNAHLIALDTVSFCTIRYYLLQENNEKKSPPMHFKVQCNLDLVTLNSVTTCSVSGYFAIVIFHFYTKSLNLVTQCNLVTEIKSFTKSRVHCTAEYAVYFFHVSPNRKICDHRY